jgi:aldose 1-epimerase
MANVVLGHRDLAGYLANAPYFGSSSAAAPTASAAPPSSSTAGRIGWRPTRAATSCTGGRAASTPACGSWIATRFVADQRARRRHPAAGLGGRRPGLPGAPRGVATLAWTARHELDIALEARCDAPTVVNLAHHGYWNLAGEGEGSVDDHVLTVRAGRLPAGRRRAAAHRRAAAGGGHALRPAERPAAGRRAARGRPAAGAGHGLDHCFVLDRAQTRTEPREAALLAHPASGRTLRVSPPSRRAGLRRRLPRRLDRRPLRPPLPPGRRARARAAALPGRRAPPALPVGGAAPGEVYRQRSVFALGVGGPAPPHPIAPTTASAARTSSPERMSSRTRPRPGRR